ncbi:MAG: hypothetical protein ACP5DC_08610 [Halothiobacillaceae bacterium]
MKRIQSILLAATIFSAPLAADEIRDQIETGLELYQEQDYGAAITELEFAINDIRKLMNEQIGELFPEAPSGWTAGEVESGGGGAALFGGGGGTMLQRQYREDGGRGQLETTLAIDNPMIQGMAAMFNNPAMLAAQPNIERVRIGRESGIVKWEPERNRGEATLLLDGRVLLQVKGQNVDDIDLIIDMIKDWDLRELRARTAR